MRKLPWGIIFLVIWGLLLTTSVTLYLKFLQPAKLGHTVSSIIESKLNLSPEIDFIKLQFFPTPAIIIKGLSLTHEESNTKIKLDEAHANLSWKTLLAGQPVIGSVSVFNPMVEIVSTKGFAQKDITTLQNTLQIKGTTNKTTQNVVTKKTSQKPAQEITTLNNEKQKELEQKIHLILSKLVQFEMPYFFSGASLHIRNGFVKIKFPQPSDNINIKNVNMDLHLPGIVDGHLDLRIEQTKLVAQKAPEIQLDKTSLIITGWRLNTNNITANIHLQSFFQMGSLQKLRTKPIKKAYRYFPMPEPARLSIRTGFNYHKNSQTLNTNGLLQAKLLLPMNAHNTPVAFKIPFSLIGLSKNDEKSILRLPKKTQENTSYLNAFLKDNNNFPDKAVKLPSLYIDTIKIDDAHVEIDSDSANITGELLGLYPFSPFFQGQATVHNFSLPRWIGAARKMSGGLVNALNHISGTMNFVVNKRGIFAHNLQGKVSGISAQGIGSCANFKKPDIALKVKPIQKSLKNNTVNLNPLFPEINGVKIKKVKLPPPAVPARDKSDKSPSIFVDYHIDIAIPQADIWKLSAKKIQSMISPDKNETPTIKIVIDDLYQGTANAFAILDDGNNYIQASAQNVNLEEPVRRIAGFTAVRGVLNSNAEIRLAGNSIEKILSSLEVKANGEIKNGSFHSMESIMQKYQSATFKIDVKTIPFYMQGIKLPPYFQMKGNYHIAMQDNNLKAEVFTNATLDFSSKNGLPLRMSPQTADIQYYLSGKTKLENFFAQGKGLVGYDFPENEYLNIKDFNGVFNGDIITASYNIRKKEQLDWSGKIHFNTINLDDYFFSEKTPSPSNTPKSDTFLPIDFLSRNSLSYELSAKEAILLGTTIQDLRSHLTLNKGNFLIEKTQGIIKGGGNIHALFEAKITENLPQKKGNIHAQAKFQIDNANMLAITKMRKHDTLVAGNALIQLNVNGIFQTSEDILRKLNGTWNVNIQNGYIQNTNVKPSTQKKDAVSSHAPLLNTPQTKRKAGSKINFNNILSSGSITDGLVFTPKFVISGQNLSVTGSGTVDLPSKQIKVNAMANYRGISEIPITVTGTIDEPITKTQILSAVAGTLGNIGVGFFETLGIILSAPIQLLTNEAIISTP